MGQAVWMIRFLSGVQKIDEIKKWNMIQSAFDKFIEGLKIRAKNVRWSPEKIQRFPVCGLEVSLVPGNGNML